MGKGRRKVYALPEAPQGAVKALGPSEGAVGGRPEPFVRRGAVVALTECRPDLSRREWQVVGMICMGHSDKQIASQLGLAVPTVKQYVTLVCPKLRASNRTHAAAIASRWGAA